MSDFLFTIPTIGGLICHWRVMLPRRKRVVYVIRWDAAPRDDDDDFARAA